MYNIDKLIARIDELGNPSVVGLDPSTEMIPESVSSELLRKHGVGAKAVAEMFRVYNMAIIDAVADIVPAVKPQIAMYERYGIEGLKCYIDTAEYARGKGLYVIGDIKRGDISSTAEAYAGHLYEDMWNEDAITVNPYLGTDGIEPFVDACRKTGKSIFVLVKTSNKSSCELQDVMVSEIGAESMPLYERVGGLVRKWGGELVGEYGYSAVGAVVGATHPQEGQRLRTLMPNTFFLVPGYGAQGATAKDIRGFFDENGRGCIVNSSRGIIAAWKKKAFSEEGTPGGTHRDGSCPEVKGVGYRLDEKMKAGFSSFGLSESSIIDLEEVAACAAEAACAMRIDITT